MKPRSVGPARSGGPRLQGAGTVGPGATVGRPGVATNLELQRLDDAGLGPRRGAALASPPPPTRRPRGFSGAPVGPGLVPALGPDALTKIVPGRTGIPPAPLVLG